MKRRYAEDERGRELPRRRPPVPRVELREARRDEEAAREAAKRATSFGRARGRL
jgi:hypothetical protein